MPVDLDGFVPHGLIPPGTALLVMKTEEQEGKHNCICACKDSASGKEIDCKGGNQCLLKSWQINEI